MPEVRVLSLRSVEEAEKALREIGAHEAGVEIMTPKAQLRVVKITDLDPRAANILKQEMLARGGEAVLSADAYHLKDGKTTALAIGTLKQFADVVPKLGKQPFGLKELSRKLKVALDAYESQPPALPVAGRLLDLAARTYVMGVVNVTPDSFSDGGEHFGVEAAVAHAKRLIEEGADIIDIGGESTRPGADPVPVEEEIARVLPVVERVSQETDGIVSIDTMKPEVADEAIRAGAHMVNDVSALSDPKMLEVVATAGVPAVLMHMKGTPRTMQRNPTYGDLMGEIIGFLKKRIEMAEAAGVAGEKLLVDPGIGFGKTVEHNLEIIKRLAELKVLGKGIVLGTSRKSFIGKVLNLDLPAERIFGTAASVAVGIVNGANVVRVHDVREMVQVARLADAIISSEVGRRSEATRS